MKVMKTIKVPASTDQVLDYVKCELCDAKSHNKNWSPAQYDVTDPTVTFEEGTHYPEGGSTTTTVLDICPKCFKEKLIPWFVSQGGTPRESESDW
jgi:hypothetical protein